MSNEDPCRCHCTPCKGGYHIFCNRYPHGTLEQAKKWFLENPEAAKEGQALSEPGISLQKEVLAEIELREK